VKAVEQLPGHGRIVRCRCDRRAPSGDSHVPGVWPPSAGDDADERLPALLSLQRVRNDPKAAPGGLLRVLLVRRRGLPAAARLLAAPEGRPLEAHPRRADWPLEFAERVFSDGFHRRLIAGAHNNDSRPRV